MRISGPLMDRIDLRIEVPAVTAADLILPPAAQGSAEVAARVAAGRDIQLRRYAALGLSNVRTNAEAPASVLEEIARPVAQGQKLMRDAAETSGCPRAAITACFASPARSPTSTAPRTSRVACAPGPARFHSRVICAPP